VLVSRAPPKERFAHSEIVVVFGDLTCHLAFSGAAPLGFGSFPADNVAQNRRPHDHYLKVGSRICGSLLEHKS
jgi:hypothetical protein